MTQFYSSLPSFSPEYGLHGIFYIPEINQEKPFHPGTILDWDGDYLLVNFFSTKPMEKFYGKKWKDQGIFPKGEGNKDMDSYGMPNQTSWIHKSHLKSKLGTFSDFYMDQIYMENEKFYGKKFEEIQFKKIIKSSKFWNL